MQWQGFREETRLDRSMRMQCKCAFRVFFFFFFHVIFFARTLLPSRISPATGTAMPSHSVSTSYSLVPGLAPGSEKTTVAQEGAYCCCCCRTLYALPSLPVLLLLLMQRDRRYTSCQCAQGRRRE